MIRPEVVRRKIEVFGEEEKLMAECQQAINGFEMQELMIDGINLYGDICRLDDNFHANAYRTPEVFDGAMWEAIFQCYRRWHEIVARVLHFFESMRTDFPHRGFEIHHRDELERLFRQCEGALHPSDVELTDLADAAIRGHQQGRTVCM